MKTKITSNANFKGLGKIVHGGKPLFFLVQVTCHGKTVLSPLFPDKAVKLADFRQWCLEANATFCGDYKDLTLVLNKIASESPEITMKHIQYIGNHLKP